MIEDEKLCDHAALCCCPDNIEEGRKKLRQIATSLARKDTIITIFCILALAAGAEILFAVVATLFDRKVNFAFSVDLLLYFGEAAIGSILLMAGIRGRKVFQTRGTLLTKDRNYDTQTPIEIEALLGELINSKFDVFEDAPEGVKKRTGKRLPSGKWGEQLPSALFKNRYAPLLLTDDIKAYQHIWRPWNDTIKHTLYILPGPNTIDETGKYRWLVMGTDRQFELGLKAFIKGCKIPSDRAEKFQIALRTARKTLQT